MHALLRNLDSTPFQTCSALLSSPSFHSLTWSCKTCIGTTLQQPLECLASVLSRSSLSSFRLFQLPLNTGCQSVAALPYSETRFKTRSSCRYHCGLLDSLPEPVLWLSFQRVSFPVCFSSCQVRIPHRRPTVAWDKQRESGRRSCSSLQAA